MDGANRARPFTPGYTDFAPVTADRADRRHRGKDQADSLALPFARRRARTLRPLEVDILLRKPCSLDL